LNQQWVIEPITSPDKQYASDVQEETLYAKMNGSLEVPPVETNGSGEVFFQVNTTQGALAVKEIPYTMGLMNMEKIVASHIHDRSNGKNGPVVYIHYLAQMNQ
jgi:hypothetical protein